MKKPYLFLVLLTCICCSCTKTKTTNIDAVSPFVIEGLSDVTMVNDYTMQRLLNVNVQYMNGAQQHVSLSLSPLPAGITIDTTSATSGIPDFSASYTFYDTTAVGAKAGTYPMTLTATTADGQKTTYSFSLIIKPMPTAFLGKYNNCTFNCGSTYAIYTDSLYLDASVPNKVWFANFANTGVSAYGYVQTNYLNAYIMIPAQTIAGTTYSTPFMSFIYLTGHNFELEPLVNNGTTTTTGFMNME